MPVPPLPLEVVGLIVDQLAAGIKDQTERRMEGVRVALVCKAWTPLGLGAAYRQLSLGVKLDEALLAFLLRHTHAATHLRRLEITGHSTASLGAFHAERGAFHDAIDRLLSASRRLKSVEFLAPLDLFDSLDVLADSQSRSSIRHFQCTTVLQSPDDLPKKLALLSSFTNLNSFALAFATLPTWTSSVNPPSAAVEPCTHVQACEICFSGEVEYITNLVLPALDPEHLKFLKTSFMEHSDAFFRHLPSFPHLKQLEIVVYERPLLDTLFPLLVQCLPLLPSLHTLILVPAEKSASPGFKDLRLSPLRLSAVLSVFPPSLDSATFRGLYFLFEPELQWAMPSTVTWRRAAYCTLYYQDEARFGTEEAQYLPLCSGKDEAGNRVTAASSISLQRIKTDVAASKAAAGAGESETAPGSEDS